LALARGIRALVAAAWDGKVDKKTALYDEHVKAGGRIVPFGGFLMPLEYSGIIDEHRAVREAVGIFDLSHMGEFRVTGADALAAVDRLVTNDIRTLDVWQVRYSPMCYPNGGIVDDLLVYRYPDHVMLVVNAANIDKDLEWVRGHLEGDVLVEDVSDDVALIAVQGPRAQELVQPLVDLDLGAMKYYHFGTGCVLGKPATISRTGYTGEDGFELYLEPQDAPDVWRRLLTDGEPLGLKPIGLGARDTLRLEAGYMLYGNDIDAETSPLEAGLGWTVKFTEHDFIGRETLERQKAGGLRRRMVAVEMLDRRIPRPHYPLLAGSDRVGELTSGTFSPTLGRGVGLAYVDPAHARVGTQLDVEIRHDRYPARVARKPLYKREGAER
jgi:aminomethyltransferase